MDTFSTLSDIFTPSSDTDATSELISSFATQPSSIEGMPLVDADRPSGDYGSFCTIA